MLDSMIVISSYEQRLDWSLALLTEQILPLLSSAPTTIVPGNAKGQKSKTQTRVMVKSGLLASFVSPIESQSSSQLQPGNQSQSEEGNRMSIHLDEYFPHPRTYEPPSSHPNTVIDLLPQFPTRVMRCTDQSSSDSYLHP